MDIVSIFIVVIGLCAFEIVTSIDNAIINAQVLSEMGQKARRWFLSWGLLFSVFVIRGVLPWFIVWASTPAIDPIGALTATFSNDASITASIERSSPMLLIAGGIFLLFLFFHWLFLEEKEYGLTGERFFVKQGVWFYAVVSVLLSVIVWFALYKDPLMAFGAVVGSTAFFITHGFRENAEKQEKLLLAKKGTLSDTSKIFFLMVIDSTFSMDGVLGAFAFTLSVPLILLGNGIGAVVIRQLTVSNIERIKNYVYLKNGAMYSLLALGTIMLLESFGVNVPNYLSPIVTFACVGYFFFKSKREVS